MDNNSLNNNQYSNELNNSNNNMNNDINNNSFINNDDQNKLDSFNNSFENQESPLNTMFKLSFGTFISKLIYPIFLLMILFMFFGPLANLGKNFNVILIILIILLVVCIIYSIRFSLKTEKEIKKTQVLGNYFNFKRILYLIGFLAMLLYYIFSKVANLF